MPKRRRKPLTRLEKMLRSDGALAVTFVNTAAPARKTLETYDDLLAWGVETGALADADAQRLAAAAAEQPAKAAGVVRGAATLRDRLERIFIALAAGERPAASDFDPLSAELGRVIAHRRLVTAGDDYRWIWGAADGDDFDRMLWPVLLSAGAILASRDRQRVRRCLIERCGLFFIARGSGSPRKWCSVKCRNRESTRKYYYGQRKPLRKWIQQRNRRR